MSAFGGKADIDHAIGVDRSSATIFSGRKGRAISSTMEQVTLIGIKV
jgi:hypothetical protein